MPGLELSKEEIERIVKEAEVNIENVVASASLDHDINLTAIATALDDIEYEPEQFPGVVYRLDDPKTATLIFSSGKFVCTGAKSPEDAKRAIMKVAEKLKEIGIDIRSEPKIEVQNIVASANLKASLNLNEIALQLENSEYEPEQFPGLIYRLDDPKVVLLLFGSGKVVCTGAKKVDDIARAIYRVISDLRDLGQM